MFHFSCNSSAGDSSGRRSVRAFTLVELLCVVAILCVLSALILSGIQRVLLAARQTASLSNLRSIGSAFAAYTADHEGRYPKAYTAFYQAPFWTDELTPYLSPKQVGRYRDWSGAAITISPVFIDPMLANGRHTTLGDYGANSALVTGDSSSATVSAMSLAAVAHPAQTVLVLTMENRNRTPPSGYWIIESYWLINPAYALGPGDRGTGKVLCLFADGHTQSVATNDFVSNRSQFLSNTP